MALQFNPEQSNHVPSGSKDLAVETESLVTFKQRVDGILSRLDDGPASHRRMSDQAISAASFGADFEMADHIHKAYQAVHDKLRTMSQMLGDHIDALSLTTDMARRGYQNVDQQQVDRLRAIQQRLAQTCPQPGQGEGHAQDASLQIGARTPQQPEGSGKTGTF
jgi:hypothetical protein